MSFGQLAIAQSGNNSIIRLADTHEVLAGLTNIQANQISAADFSVV